MRNKSKVNKVLLTGGTGLLGTHLIRTLPQDVKLYATVHTYKQVLEHPRVTYLDLDVTDFSSVSKAVNKINPDVIIHTAAHSQVDFCENNQSEAQLTNLESTKKIVDESNKINAKVLFCSSNMVFDGLNAPYREESVLNPQTYYGKTKALSEEYIQKNAKHFTIFRLMTMYGWNWQPKRKNMVSMAIERLRLGQELWMTNDVYNNMLYVRQAAETFWESITKEKADRQIYQLAGSDCVNRYQTTEKVCNVFNLDFSKIHEVSSDYFKGKEASRAPNSCFLTKKVERDLQFSPLTLKEGLQLMKRDESET